MAKDPAFLFYPGDYLRDTQNLSELTQVAYDRIMCEHMRNICISQSQLKFFTKRLSHDEKEELMTMLKKVPGGYQIDWVAQSIENRRNYSESRRKNRNKTKKDMSNISQSYVSHMENENENENEIVIEDEKKVRTVFKKPETEQIKNFIVFTFPDIPPEKINDVTQSFFDYYQSNGWRVGKNPMKDWQASLRNWIRRDKNPQNGTDNTKEKRVGRMAESGIKRILETEIIDTSNQFRQKNN